MKNLLLLFALSLLTSCNNTAVQKVTASAQAHSEFLSEWFENNNPK
jgi:hypothetical protein